MPTAPFPPDFPEQLAHAAFLIPGEAAWRPAEAISAVEWFAAHGYCVLGTELWLIDGGRIQSLPLGLSGMREAHGNAVKREDGEPWNLFVSRAAEETISYLKSFNSDEIVESGEIYFNVTWVGESQHHATN
jgi:hypothetical protein